MKKKRSILYLLIFICIVFIDIGLADEFLNVIIRDNGNPLITAVLVQKTEDRKVEIRGVRRFDKSMRVRDGYLIYFPEEIHRVQISQKLAIGVEEVSISRLGSSIAYVAIKLDQGSVVSISFGEAGSLSLRVE